jgi:hypothetical protein
MNKYLLALLLFLLTACASEPPTTPSATPTPPANPAEIGLTMFADKVNAEATQAAVNQVFTATAQVIAITSTSQFLGTQEAVTQQARIDAQATSEQGRRDAAATQQRRDDDAVATQQRIDIEATQAQAQRVMNALATQARVDLEATQRAEATATSWAVTEAVIPLHDSWTQQAVEQDIVIATNEVELSNMAVQQEKRTWAIPWVIGLGLFVVGSLMTWFWMQVRTIKNEDGGPDVIIYKNRLTVRPDLFALPMLDLETNTMPPLADPKEQSAVTMRAQAIQALSVMPSAPASNAATAYNGFFPAQKRDEAFDVVDADEVPSHLLDSETRKVLDKDWKDANDK